MRLIGYLKNAVIVMAMLAVAGTASARGLGEQALNGVLAGGFSQQLAVQGKGTISAVTGTCPAVTLTIQGIPVTVDASTKFPVGQSCAQLAATQNVEVRGVLTITGTTLSVVATTIDIQNGTEREGEGRVEAVTGTCPAITMTVDGLSIQADALTTYIPANRGADCDQIRVGTKIKASTVPLAGGGLRARLIEIKGQRHFGEGEGRITSVSGACPDLRIFFGNMPVDVNAATNFVGGTCADLAAGVSVQARGFKDDDATTNIASWIRFKARHVEGRSVVTKVTGTCPALAFTVGGVVKVVTDANTVFVGGSCDTIRTGVKVHVSGDMKADDGSVIAERVTIEDQPGGRNGGRLEGLVGATVTGTCPALTFTVKGITVTTSATTKFDNIACSAIKAGVKVEVEGDLTGNTLAATKVELDN